VADLAVDPGRRPLRTADRSLRELLQLPPGTDLDAGRGTAIAAIADGVVTQVGNPSGTCGVFAIIQHDIDAVASRRAR
jgi:murein DD-endopeptidase MepM/ murein hydrolase activator NlpD